MRHRRSFSIHSTAEKLHYYKADVQASRYNQIVYQLECSITKSRVRERVANAGRPVGSTYKREMLSTSFGPPTHIHTYYAAFTTNSHPSRRRFVIPPFLFRLWHHCFIHDHLLSRLLLESLLLFHCIRAQIISLLYLHLLFFCLRSTRLRHQFA